MITVQWAETGEISFTGLEYGDEEYLDALENFEEHMKDWDIVRLIFSWEDDPEWVVVHQSGVGKYDLHRHQ